MDRHDRLVAAGLMYYTYMYAYVDQLKSHNRQDYLPNVNLSDGVTFLNSIV